ncbi:MULTISPECIES: uroporphyrinogen decarboxylase [Prochlorococcus]|uniref:Uroporphyrinogen decarboxylase n=1 Tax=Prochlorococcus marinus (strain SARG / CCMP1375 / SS120) TaxID=167539 RepID=DCUP_PROMA|nr:MULTISPECIES: uroporphyrinogen decarboxylase [Prochlorococcus]Q7VBL3.1 RecName: Full=Uroporphyrinogen decarboxylase; Short=UPD; Short=URO-D [Prochlorococcus marinus subsp. marinus str. CCMP1375]AAQ00124.1 Uroporphyrinogen decarboxylase [Prochlorococcus marinus subsp. marinus str. CCMP1375]KGG13920.1 Uroporphyrinogen III decarboxylase [Prochlorococcus marinus str. LG]KGG19053.1 Uroporphyrinogen III decarboxylase [Prochlorococcus marinus str. SS2]KGG23407.1 Uroporphyrinogen III decarboxylase 
MTDSLPLLLRAARGESVNRPPVWMMRQAGRYMKVYRELRDNHPSFRERSENPDLSYEISMQPFREFKPDGVILFSDILTPLPGMGIDFDIVESKGPLINDPIRTLEQVKTLRPLEPQVSLPFVGEVLGRLRESVKNEAAVLGFVGAPWTLAAYVVEGKSSKNYSVIKAMAFQQPDLLHKLLNHFAESIANYLKYQIESGAQVVQMFDSWAGQLSPIDYDNYAAPYQKKVVDLVKQSHPDTPMILYISGSAGVIERMAKTGVDIVSLDWTVDMAEGCARLPNNIGIQGNVDPGILFGTPKMIQERIIDTVKKAKGRKHILNLGHGILPGTPEENAKVFFETGKNINNLISNI